jgi:hypothetical protein
MAQSNPSTEGSSAMTEAQVRRLIETWAKRLGLERWRIEVTVGTCESESAYMEVNRSTVYERATLTVASWVVGVGNRPEPVIAVPLTEDFIEACVVHELLHLHTRDLRAVVRDDCDGLVHPDAYRQLDATAERIEEQTVDRLAEALVRAWPR